MTTSLGVLIVAVMVKVTCLAVPAAVICRLASRKGPAAGSWAAGASLLLILAITFASFLPAPARRVQRISASESTERAATTSAMRTVSAEGSETARPGSSPRGFSLSLLMNRWRDVPTRLNLNVPASSRWPMAVAWLTIPGIALGMARLALGLWTIADCRRKSTKLNDPRASALLTAIAEAAGCSRAIELREFHTSRSPATAGWLRPVIYLPPTWTAWSDGDLRAVLSHEVAHIQRSDYAIGLMARLAEAIHFYHPAVRWLTARLLTQQELAANALGASLSGGKAPYLAALSRIALGNDAPPAWWPARTFAPAKGTLIRRIEMLKTHDDSRPNSWPHPRRLATGAALAAIALAVCLIPNPISRAADPGEPPRPATMANTSTQPRPFDLRYIPPRSMGVVAIHPSALFGKPGMEGTLSRTETVWAGNFPDMLKEFGLPPSACPLKLSQIEEVTMPMSFDLWFSPGGTLRRFNTTGLAIRTTEPFDWQSLIRKWWPELTEVQQDGHCYYKAIPSKQTEAVLGKAPCFLFPDDRTLVYYNEPDMQSLLQSNGLANSELANSPKWKATENDLIALVLDNRDDQILNATKRTEEEDDGDFFATTVSNANLLVCGVANKGDDVAFHAYIRCEDQDKPKLLSKKINIKIKESLKKIDSMIDETLKAIENSQAPHKDQTKEMIHRHYEPMSRILKSLKTIESGDILRIESRPEARLIEVLADFIEKM